MLGEEIMKALYDVVSDAFRMAILPVCWNTLYEARYHAIANRQIKCKKLTVSFSLSLASSSFFAPQYNS